MYTLRLDFRARAIVSVGTVVLFAAIVVFSQSSREEPLPAGAGKDKAEDACLSCHEARIIVQQRLNKAAWTKEVDKMIKWGAEVDARDRDTLIDYFSANFSPDKPAFEAPRTVAARKEKAK